ncbi:hypothetical protein B0H14DRAFT_2591010 [Mycena olivaceomarginata]|nr:hypothetical protein B0H14DRAFT_2591010 [Mycena olivaceomarginata]
MSSTVSFAAYTAPHTKTRFSPEFFASITIAEAADLVRNNLLPCVLPKNSVSKWVWDHTEPTAIPEIVITSRESIPCLEDIYPITQKTEAAYYQYAAHSLHLIVAVNNQTYNLIAVANLLGRVVSAPLLLPELIEEVRLSQFSEPLAGFHVTQTRVYTLGCLLNEQWVHEEVLNTRAELIYFRQLIALPDRPYSSDIIRLREHICTGNVDTIGFITWTNNHFSAVCKVFLAELEGDSLHLPTAPDILPIFRWAFNGLGHFAPPPEQVHIQPGHIDRQRTLAGGGSCGVLRLQLKFRWNSSSVFQAQTQVPSVEFQMELEFGTQLGTRFAN